MTDRIDIEDGKYTIVGMESGWLRALRYGEEWRPLTGDNLVLCMAQEIERLRGWKSEALAVLFEWEKAWFAAGRPGRIGTSKAASVREEIERLRGESDWEYGVSWDSVEGRVFMPTESEWRAGVEVRRMSTGDPYPEENYVVRRRPAGPWGRVEGEGDE